MALHAYCIFGWAWIHVANEYQMTCFCTNKSAKIFALLRVGVSVFVRITVYFSAFRHVGVCGRIYDRYKWTYRDIVMDTKLIHTQTVFSCVCEGFICWYIIARVYVWGAYVITWYFLYAHCGSRFVWKWVTGHRFRWGQSRLALPAVSLAFSIFYSRGKGPQQSCRPTHKFGITYIFRLKLFSIGALRGNHKTKAAAKSCLGLCVLCLFCLI